MSNSKYKLAISIWLRDIKSEGFFLIGLPVLFLPLGLMFSSQVLHFWGNNEVVFSISIIVIALLSSSLWNFKIAFGEAALLIKLKKAEDFSVYTNLVGDYVIKGSLLKMGKIVPHTGFLPKKTMPLFEKI